MEKVILKITELDDGSMQTEINPDPIWRPENVGIMLADTARHFEQYFNRVGRGPFLSIITDFLLRELDNPTSPITEIEKPEIH